MHIMRKNFIVNCCSILIIFQSMDEELEWVEERASVGSGQSTNTKKAQPCCICKGKINIVRRHVLTSHLPWYVAPLTACWSCKIQFGQRWALAFYCSAVHNGSQDSLYKTSQLHSWVEL